MQRHSIKQVEAVTGNTPQELANNYNEAMRRLQGALRRTNGTAMSFIFITSAMRRSQNASQTSTSSWETSMNAESVPFAPSSSTATEM